MKHIFFCLVFLITGIQVNATSSYPPNFIGEPLTTRVSWYAMNFDYLIINSPFEGEYYCVVTDSNMITGIVHFSDTLLVTGKGKISTRISGLTPETEYWSIVYFFQGDSIIAEDLGMNKTKPIPPQPNYFVMEEGYVGISDLLVKISSEYPVLVYAVYGFHDDFNQETERILHLGGLDTIILPLTTPVVGEYEYLVIFEFSDSISTSPGVLTHFGVLKILEEPDPEPTPAPDVNISHVEADCGTISFHVQVTPVVNDTASMKIYLSSNQLDWYTVDSVKGISRNSAFDGKVMGLSADTEFFIRVIGISKDGIADTTEKSVMMPAGEKPTLNIVPKITNETAEFNFAGFMGCDGGFLELSVQGPSNFDTTIFVGAQSYEGKISLELESGDYFWEACVENQHEVCKTGNFSIQSPVTNIFEQQKELVRNAISPSAQTLINDTLGRQIGSVLWGDIKNSEQNPLNLIGAYILFVPSSDYSEKRIFTK